MTVKTIIGGLMSSDWDIEPVSKNPRGDFKDLKIISTSAGSPHHCQRFVNHMRTKGLDIDYAKMLPNKYYIDPSSYDVMLNVGFFDYADILTESVKRDNPDIKIINLWIGTDIIRFKFFTDISWKCLECKLQSVDYHAADSPGFCWEVKHWFGVDCSYIIIPPRQVMSIKPLPPLEDYTVCCYAQDYRADYYNYGLFVFAARTLPRVSFKMISIDPTKKEFKRSPNMDLMGFVPEEDFHNTLENSHLYAYVPRHGSPGISMVESLQMGRMGVFNRWYPYLWTVTTGQDFVNLIQYLRVNQVLDVDGARYYQRLYSADTAYNQLSVILNQILGGERV